MQMKKKKQDQQVHILTNKTCMKFMPTNFIKPAIKAKALVGKNPASSTNSRFSLSSIFRGTKSNIQITSKSQIDDMAQHPQSTFQPQSSIKQLPEPEPELEPKQNHKLKFVTRISSEHILIGNQYQLDLIYVVGINSNRFVQTQYVWSFRYGEPIRHVSADQRKFNLLAIVVGKKLYVYKYDMKKLAENQPIQPFRQVLLAEEIKFLQVAKDGNICLFYNTKAEIYLVGEDIRRRFDKPYPKPEAMLENSKYDLFIVPDAFENIVNAFFDERNPDNQKIFTLWCVEFEFLSSEIKMSAPQKIYDVKTSLKKTLKFRNYSKEIFLMNLGVEILALKKGYILDSANVNLKSEQSYLEYIGNDTLLHISQKRVEVYSFSVNQTIKPYRILIKPKDSIKIEDNDGTDEFFKVLNIFATDYMTIFQKRNQNNHKSGQVEYSFYITRGTKKQNKINQLFPKEIVEEIKINDPILMEKCDMAQKMGFTTREIYLQLWNRTQQSRPEDYDILTATKDYNTIKQQIIRKLKKSSMNFKQIQKIQKDCYKMLHDRVFSPSCTEQAVMDYISSHFFLRKLNMYIQIQNMLRFEKEKKTGIPETDLRIKMAIRQYQEYKSMEIKSYLIQLINQFCHEEKKDVSVNIRFLLKNFRFVYKIIYYELLDQIIKTAKEKLLDLIVEIPELLPYYPPERQTSLSNSQDFYKGVWPEITPEQWRASLYIDAITTIDNKQIVQEQVIKNINFKRNFLSQHDMVTESVEKIKLNQIKIKSPLTFYFFIAKIFQYIKDKNILEKIVEFLEATYELPENIKGNVFLMQRMYRYFVNKNIVPELQGKPLTLNQFLAFEDKQYIRHCFQKQRSNKGLLLKDMKDLFKQVLKEQADQKYNTALLNYFTSSLSQVSDLKYILNRINNQKLEFHQENTSMYEVLIEALERKLKIGTDDDIPIEEVLIYIENIPLKFNTQPSKSLDELKLVEKIGKDSKLLREAKVNMSIHDILHDYEQVFNKLLGHAVSSADPQVWTSFEEFEKFTISKIALIENFSEEIYENTYEKAIFFLYLVKICEQKDRIKFADFLIKNQHFEQRITSNTAQGLVPYMMKWKLTLQKQYIKNQEYIRELLTLLPPESNTYIYIECQLQFAKMLSAPQNPVTYPISQIHITASDVRDIIMDLPINFVLTVPIQQLFKKLQKMQDILIEDMNMQQDQQQYLSISNRITLHQIYQYFIIKLIQSNKLKQVLPLLRKLLELDIANPTYNIVYMILFVINISNQFNQSSRNNLVQCIWYYFYDPIGLLEIFQYISNVPLSSKQVKQYIEDSVARGKEKSKGYNKDNPVFDPDCLSLLLTPQDQSNFMLNLQKTSKHIQNAKQQFKNVKYAAIMIMLCNSPYALAKYISCSYSYDLHVRSIRSFLSYAIKEVMFKPLWILELGRRVFIILLESAKNKYPVQVMIEKYEEYELDVEFDIEMYLPPKQKNNYEYLMWKSAEAFKKKKLAFTDQLKRKVSPPESAIQKKSRLLSQLDKADIPHQGDAQLEYPFTEIDSDNEGNNQMEIDGTKRKKKQIPLFNPSQEMQKVLKADNRPHKLFLSTRGEIANRPANNLLVSIRHPYKTLNNPVYDSAQDFNKLQQPARVQVQHIDKKSSRFKQPNLEHRQSHDFYDSEQKRSVCHTDKDKDQKLRPSQSGIDSEPRRSADSSPDIILNKYHDKIMEGELLQSQQHIQQQQKELPENSPIMEEKLEKSKSKSPSQHSRSRSFQEGVLPYSIQIKEVFDADDFQPEFQNSPCKVQFEEEPEVMVESTQFQSPIVAIVKRLLELNRDVITNPLLDYDFTALKSYDHDEQTLISILRELYQQHYVQINLNKKLKLMGQIINNFPVCGLDPEIFATIIKAQQTQAKAIPEIKFTNLISEFQLCLQYSSKRELFEKIYGNLRKFIDSENIYKISQFIRRVFDSNPDFQQEVTWDFVLDLAEKLTNNEREERNWNLEKIEGTLPKVDVEIWTRKIDSFRRKILPSPYKNELLNIFCGYLRTKIGDEHAISFLESLNQVEKNAVVSGALQFLQSNS